MAVPLEILIKASDQASGPLKNIQKQASGLGNTMGAALKVGALAGAVGLGALAVAALDFVKAAAIDEASVAKLQKAVENTGASWANYSGKLDATVTAAQKMAFTDDAARDALSLLMAQTGDAEEAMRRFTLAQDVARGAGIDLEMSSKLLGKVTEENVNVFKKMGINLQEGASEAEAFAALQAKFGGQAEVYAKSTAGQFAQMGIQVGELKEKIGYALLPVALKLGNVLLNDVVPALNKFADIVSKGITAGIKTVGPYMAALGDTLQTKVIPAVKEFWQVHGPGIVNFLKNAAVWLGDFGKTALEMGSAIAKFLAPALDTLADLWRSVLAPALEAIMPYLEKVGGFLSQHKELLVAIGLVALALATPAPGLVALLALIAVVLAKWDEISKMFSVTIPAAIDKFLDKIGEIPIIGEIFKAAWNDIVVLTTAAWDIIKVYVETAINIVKDTIKIVTALIHGDWKEAWNGVKQLFTDIWDGIAGLVGVYLDTIKGLFIDRLNLIKGIWGDVWNGLTQGADLLATQVQTFLNTALGGLFALPSRALGIGSDIVTALWNGIQSLRGWLMDRLGELVGGIVDKLDPRNWDIPGLSPFLSAYKHIGKLAMEEMLAGMQGAMAGNGMGVLRPSIAATVARAPLGAAGGISRSAPGSPTVIQHIHVGEQGVFLGDAYQQKKLAEWMRAQGFVRRQDLS
jgi:hypothetical protein